MPGAGRSVLVPASTEGHCQLQRQQQTREPCHLFIFHQWTKTIPEKLKLAGASRLFCHIVLAVLRRESAWQELTSGDFYLYHLRCISLEQPYVDVPICINFNNTMLHYTCCRVLHIIPCSPSCCVQLCSLRNESPTMFLLR